MKRLLLIFFLIPLFSLGQGRLPFQIIRQTYRGDTIDVKLGTTNVEYKTSLDGFSFNRSITTPYLSSDTSGTYLSKGIKIGDKLYATAKDTGTIRYHKKAFEWYNGSEWAALGGGSVDTLKKIATKYDIDTLSFIRREKYVSDSSSLIRFSDTTRIIATKSELVKYSSGSMIDMAGNKIAVDTCVIKPVYFDFIKANIQAEEGWADIAMSAFGQYQLVGGNNKPLYRSIDYGVNWEMSSSSVGLWRAVAIDSTGQYQSAVMFNGYVYHSSDYGVTWVQSNSPTGKWMGISMSSTGQYQTAVGEGVYYSNDYGSSWTKSKSGDIRCIAISSTGQFQTAGEYGGTIYNSSDYGVTWVSVSQTFSNWYNISMSKNGKYRLASNGNGYYVSSNYGAKYLCVKYTSYCDDVGMSYSGKYMFVSGFGGASPFRYSVDYGATWHEAPYGVGYFSVSCDGQRISAARNSIYYSQYFKLESKFPISYPSYKSLAYTDSTLIPYGILVKKYSGSLTDGAPTNSEITAIVGNASDNSGLKTIIKDVDGTGYDYLVISNGSRWSYTVLTIAL